jgi:crotonobetainyl-CoA:carnitine CoA-transferase CaiB-like acyl-CoA transferase
VSEPSASHDEASAGPLAGVRVVELGVWVAGPAAGGVMADWGADVVKVEPPTGDPQRSIFGAVGLRGDLPVPPFEVDNRGKRSVVLDLRSPAGRGDLERLLDTADVFVTNLRPGALERLGLGADDVCRRHPTLVYGSVTGYGLDGDDRDRAGYDVGAYWARSGLAHTLVPPGESPPASRSGMGDHQTGMTLAAGVLAKLVERGRTGRGGLVATSLLRTGMYAIAWDMGIQLRFGRRESTRARTRSRAPLVNDYRAGDGRGFWLICLEADRHWPNLLAAIERPDLMDDERFGQATSRLEHSEALVAELDLVFATRPLDEWAERFDRADVWWAPIQSIVDVIADPQARPGFVEMSPRVGEEPYLAVNTPVDFGGYAIRPGPVPTLGEHTAEVLAEVSAEVPAEVADASESPEAR